MTKITIGEIFTNLKVMAAFRKPGRRNMQFVCECVCGNTIECEAHALYSGRNKSCGCLKAKRIIEFNKLQTNLLCQK